MLPELHGVTVEDTLYSTGKVPQWATSPAQDRPDAVRVQLACEPDSLLTSEFFEFDPKPVDGGDAFSCEPRSFAAPVDVPGRLVIKIVRKEGKHEMHEVVVQGACFL